MQALVLLGRLSHSSGLDTIDSSRLMSYLLDSGELEDSFRCLARCVVG